MDYTCDVNTEELELDLELSEDIKDTQEEDLNYPCIVLEGAVTKDECIFLMECATREDISLPLYIRYGSLTRLAGKFELSIDYLLKLRYLNENYSISVYKSVDNISKLDINDPETLKKFIVL